MLGELAEVEGIILEFVGKLLPGVRCTRGGRGGDGGVSFLVWELDCPWMRWDFMVLWQSPVPERLVLKCGGICWFFMLADPEVEKSLLERIELVKVGDFSGAIPY